MKTLTFVTGNGKKVATLKKDLGNLVLDTDLVQKDLEIIEPQAESAREIALSKARQAYVQLGRPLVVDDSSFHIEAFGGFPGPYVKYMMTTIGAEGIVKFMEGQTNRRAYFTSYLVYVDAKGAEHIFEDDPFQGTIVEGVDTYEHADDWSPLWRIFIPEGESCVLGRMSKGQWRAINQKRAQSDAYLKFCDWYKNHGS